LNISHPSEIQIGTESLNAIVVIDVGFKRWSCLKGFTSLNEITLLIEKLNEVSL
jgi:hypothetical protein